MVYGDYVARRTAEEGPEECEAFFEEVIERKRENPNNIIYDYETEVEEKTEEVPPEFHIWKRRQRTDAGDPEPTSPCDDKGYPLYIDEEGNLTRGSEGNEIAWGPWIDGSEEGVSVDTVNVPSKRCRAEEIRARYHRYPTSEERAEELVRRDRAHHFRQQKRRKNKIQVEYDIREEREGSSHPVWECRVKRIKARDYPEDWAPADYDPNSVEILSPITIHLSWKEKRDGRWVKTGAGNFKGRKNVKKWGREGRLFATRALYRKLEEMGFESQGRQYGDGGIFWLPAPGDTGEPPADPGRGDDVCLVEASWSSYYDPSFGYTHSGLDGMRLFDPDRDRSKIPIGGSDEFRKADFSVAQISGLRKNALRGEKAFHKYTEQAPASTTTFCREKFDKAVRAAMVKIGDDLPKVR
jgi:hypothetical protein